MKPAPFEYDDPRTLDEALTLLAAHGEDAKPIAGGQSLIPLLNLRLAAPARLIDLNRVDELDGCSAQDGALRLGCLVRHRVVERSPLVKQHAPLLAMVAPHVAHPQIRTRGTLGGSLAHADPAAELPAAVLALDGTIHAQSHRGSRSIPASQFFDSYLTTVLEPDELLVSVEIPSPPSRTGFGFEEMAARRGDFALAGAAVSVTLDERGTIERAAIACLSAASTPVRLPSVEAALVGLEPCDATFRGAQALTTEAVDPRDSVQASATYKRRVLGVLVRRALATATGTGSEVSA